MPAPYVTIEVILRAKALFTITAFLLAMVRFRVPLPMFTARE